jgi:homoserine dehydrogenase
MRIALIGYGSVGQAFARLLERQRRRFPFRITAIQTRQRTAYDPHGLPLEPAWGPPVPVGEFLDRAAPEVVIEITSLNPVDGEPAISHIRAAFARGLPVITANKGPIAHAYSALRAEAAARHILFRFESTVMDGSPVFNLVRNNLPGVTIEGISGVLNSTTKVVLAEMAQGRSLAEGIARAQRMGIAEADPSYDIDGWDSAAKTAALANVLMDANVTPQSVQRTGIGAITPEAVRRAAAEGTVLALVSRVRREADGALTLTTQPERLARHDLLANVDGTSNVLLLHTDLMGTQGIVSVSPGVEQTAYGLFADLVDIAQQL